MLGTQDGDKYTAFEIDMREYEVAIASASVRQAAVVQYSYFSVTLAGALLAALAAFGSSLADLPLTVLAIVPLPFLVFAILILREDLLMASHERYIYELRARILHGVGQPSESPHLRFISSQKRLKTRGLFGLLSALRYAPAAIVSPLCLIAFVSNASLSFTGQALMDGALISIDCLVSVALIVGILTLQREHASIDRLVPGPIVNPLSGDTTNGS